MNFSSIIIYWCFPSSSKRNNRKLSTEFRVIVVSSSRNHDFLLTKSIKMGVLAMNEVTGGLDVCSLRFNTLFLQLLLFKLVLHLESHFSIQIIVNNRRRNVQLLFKDRIVERGQSWFTKSAFFFNISRPFFLLLEVHKSTCMRWFSTESCRGNQF